MPLQYTQHNPLVISAKISSSEHEHIFLSQHHSRNEWRTWLVIGLTFCSMIIEITCGVLFNSVALLADGVHMSSHAIAFFIAAYAYTYSRKHANNPKYVFGTGKIGELAAYTSAIILTVIALYILYDAISRIILPEPIDYLQALPVAFVGLFANILSGVILMVPCGDDNGNTDMGHSHGHGHGHSHNPHVEYSFDEVDDECFAAGSILNHGHGHAHDNSCNHFKVNDPDHSTFEHEHEHGHEHDYEHGHEHGHDAAHDHSHSSSIQSYIGVESDHVKNIDNLEIDMSHSHSNSPHDHSHDHDHSSMDQLQGHDNSFGENSHVDQSYIEIHNTGHTHAHDSGHSHEDQDSHNILNVDIEEVPLELSDSLRGQTTRKKEKYERDNNFRAAIIHVLADAFVSVLVIIALVIVGTVPAAYFLDPLVAIIGSFVILSWAYQLILDTSESLLDMCPDLNLVEKIRNVLQNDGATKVEDLHVWKVGPGHLSAVISVATTVPNRNWSYYQWKLRGLKTLSHLTIQVHNVEKLL